MYPVEHIALVSNTRTVNPRPVSLFKISALALLVSRKLAGTAHALEEAAVMKGHVIVLRNGDDAEDVLHYVEDIARPGLIITFCVEHNSRALETVATQRFDSGGKTPDKHLSESRSDGSTQAIAMDAPYARILLSCQRLRKRGVTVTLRVYTGNLKQMLRGLMEKECVESIVLRQHKNRFLSSLLSLGRRSTGLAASASSTPFLLYRRKNTCRDSDVHQ